MLSLHFQVKIYKRGPEWSLLRQQYLTWCIISNHCHLQLSFENYQPTQGSKKVAQTESWYQHFNFSNISAVLNYIFWKTSTWTTCNFWKLLCTYILVFKNMYAFGSTLSDVTYTDHLHHHGTIWIGHVDQHSM